MLVYINQIVSLKIHADLVLIFVFAMDIFKETE